MRHAALKCKLDIIIGNQFVSPTRPIDSYKEETHEASYSAVVKINTTTTTQLFITGSPYHNLCLNRIVHMQDSGLS